MIVLSYTSSIQEAVIMANKANNTNSESKNYSNSGKNSNMKSTNMKNSNMKNSSGGKESSKSAKNDSEDCSY